jgi:hypothetical protein
MKTIKEFVEAYKAKRFMNIKTAAEEKAEWLRNELEIKTYIPFKQKREIAEMIVAQNIREVDGIKKYDDINSYVSLVVASIVAHTNLQFEQDPVEDYDLLAETGLLPQIIAEFQSSHEEIGILLKMAVAAELEDNNINVLVGHFLDNILKKLDGVSEALKTKVEGLDLKELLGDIKPEDLTKLSGLLDKLK